VQTIVFSRGPALDPAGGTYRTYRAGFMGSYFQKEGKIREREGRGREKGESNRKEERGEHPRLLIPVYACLGL